jgi:hypothetical protein
MSTFKEFQNLNSLTKQVETKSTGAEFEPQKVNRLYEAYRDFFQSLQARWDATSV